METAWLIEGKNNTYIGSSPLVEEIYAGGSRLGWVPGHENALRLARREDAEFIKEVCIAIGIRFDPDAPGVSKHMWFDEQAASSEEKPTVRQSEDKELIWV